MKKYTIKLCTEAVPAFGTMWWSRDVTIDADDAHAARDIAAIEYAEAIKESHAAFLFGDGPGLIVLKMPRT